VLETELMKLIKEQLDISIAGHAGVDQNAYEAALNRVRGVAQGRRSDRDLKRLVVNAIEDYGMKIKRGWLFNWYKAIKREVGEA
jgi:hypothetical protein